MAGAGADDEDEESPWDGTGVADEAEEEDDEEELLGGTEELGGHRAGVYDPEPMDAVDDEVAEPTQESAPVEVANAFRAKRKRA